MKRVVMVLCLCGAGCAANMPVGGVYSVPRDSASQCVRHCESLDLRFAALVIISNSTGCICEPRDSDEPPRTASRAAGAVGGVIRILESAEPPTALELGGGGNALDGK